MDQPAFLGDMWSIVWVPYSKKIHTAISQHEIRTHCSFFFFPPPSGKVGSTVIVPYRGEENACRHLKLLGDLGQIVPMWYNIRNKETVKRAVQHSNVVINLVGKHWETRNFSFYDVNVVAAATIAEVFAFYPQQPAGN